MTAVLTRGTAVVAAVALLSLTAACSSSGAGSGGSKKTIAVVPGITSDPFFKAMKIGAEAEAKKLGYKIDWQGSAKAYSPQEQVPYVDTVLAKKPAGLILIPTDQKALQPSVTKAKAAKIPVLTVDTTVADQSPLIGFITGDNKLGGSQAADAIATAIGYQPGGHYQVAICGTSATTTTGQLREQGFNDQLKAKYPGIEVVDKQYSQSNPQTATSFVNNWLVKYPKLAGIFADDGTDTTGAAAALVAKHKQNAVALVGYDAYPEEVALLKNGSAAALIAQRPGDEAAQAVQAMVNYLKTGKTGIAKDVILPNVTMTKDNLGTTSKYTYAQ